MFHEAFVVFGGGLNDGIVHGFGTGFMFGRDVLFFWFTASSGEHVHNHAQGVNDRVETRTGIDRKLEGTRGCQSVSGLVRAWLRSRLFRDPGD